jgi:hypothetical protein
MPQCIWQVDSPVIVITSKALGAILLGLGVTLCTPIPNLSLIKGLGQ